MESSADNPTRSSATQWLVVLACILGTCDLLLVTFVVPVSAEMFIDFGVRPSWLTMFFLDMSEYLSANHYVGLGFLVFAFLSGSFGGLPWLEKRDHKRREMKWRLAMLIFLIALTLTIIGSMLVPVFSLGAVTG